MKNLLKSIAVFYLTAMAVSVFSQNIVLKQSRQSGIYQLNESIQVQAILENVEADSLHIHVLKNDVHIVRDDTIAMANSSCLLFQGAFDEPVSFIFEVRADSQYASTGFVVAPEQFRPGTERPADMEACWQSEKKQLRALPMEIDTLRVQNVDSGFVCYNTEINCTGPKPARGYFAKPQNALNQSLPIVLNLHAAGVAGHWCLARPENAMHYARQGALCFDLNAHGMRNGQPQAYYDDLEKGALKSYFFQGVERRQDVYFRGMYLRLIRTLDFLTDQPEWDGRRILVIGESQGGGQALAAAGLDHRVTDVVAIVPALCDWGGRLKGRKGGWPDLFNLDKDQDLMLAALPYFDAAHLLKGCQASIFTEIGLIDQTCPPASIYAAVNQAEGRKIICAVPYRGHHLKQLRYRPVWEETVYQPRMEFVKAFLKRRAGE